MASSVTAPTLCRASITAFAFSPLTLRPSLAWAMSEKKNKDKKTLFMGTSFWVDYSTGKQKTTLLIRVGPNHIPRNLTRNV